MASCGWMDDIVDKMLVNVETGVFLKEENNVYKLSVFINNTNSYKYYFFTLFIEVTFTIKLYLDDDNDDTPLQIFLLLKM